MENRRHHGVEQAVTWDLGGFYYEGSYIDRAFISSLSGGNAGKAITVSDLVVSTDLFRQLLTELASTPTRIERSLDRDKRDAKEQVHLPIRVTTEAIVAWTIDGISRALQYAIFSALLSSVPISGIDQDLLTVSL